MNQSTEQWLHVPDWEGLYEVSDLGRVRRVAGGQGARANHILKQHPVSAGNYLGVTLCRNGMRRSAMVHTLVLEAFSGARPPGMEACHSDGDSHNNRATNLRWDTVAENKLDTVRHRTHRYGKRDTCSRGHDLVPPNLMPQRMGRSRDCRACALSRMSARDRGVELTDEMTHERYARIMRS